MSGAGSAKSVAKSAKSRARIALNEEAQFADKLLTWYDAHGRKDLPWQRHRTPYRVWVSEIMLQQTQVATVIAYFERFTHAFPDVQSLAAAPLDRVLHIWSGLGYYARARNLHEAAVLIVDRFGGDVPRSLDALMSLPGVGRSTAGAILSIAFDEPAPILDGNVKRVLARIHAVDGWPGNARVAKGLWSLAEQSISHERPADYTQAIMDLGATLCTRASPACSECQLSDDCIAFSQHCVERHPAPRPKRVLPTRHTRMLIVRNTVGEVLLEQRPPTGIWGGLWCFPEADPDERLSEILKLAGLAASSNETAAHLTHTFTHFRLEIEPILVRLASEPLQIMEGAKRLWYKNDVGHQIGLAAPVKRMLAKVGAEGVFV